MELCAPNLSINCWVMNFILCYNKKWLLVKVKVQLNYSSTCEKNIHMKVTLMYYQMTNSRSFLENSMARRTLWLKSLISFLYLSVTFFRFCSNICSIAFKVAWFALGSYWLSSSWLGTLSKEDSCWSSRDSSNISQRQLTHMISPPLCMPHEWNMVDITMLNLKLLRPPPSKSTKNAITLLQSTSKQT